MEVITAFLLCLTVLFSQAEEENERSHDIWLTKLDKPQLNPDWLTDLSYKLKKISKHGKSIYLNVTLQNDIDGSDIMCEVKVYQKSGGKYMKAPADLPPTPCCQIMKDNENNIWPCLQEATNFPKNCPIPKGVIFTVDFNPGACVYPKNLPPRLPEEYKVVFTGSLKSVELWKYVAYGVIKKRMDNA